MDVRARLSEAYRREAGSTYRIRRGSDALLYTTLVVATLATCGGPFVVPFLVLAAVLGKLGEGWVLVLTSGIVVRDRKRERFVRYDAIEMAHAIGSSVHFELRDGERIHLRFGLNVDVENPFPNDVMAAQLAREVELFRDAAHRSLTRTELPVLVAALESTRGLAPLRRIVKLRELGDPDLVTYRAAPIDREGLWRVLENPSFPAEQRIGAAIALRWRADVGEQARLSHALRSADRDDASRELVIAGSETDEEILAGLLERSTSR